MKIKCDKSQLFIAGKNEVVLADGLIEAERLQKHKCIVLQRNRSTFIASLPSGVNMRNLSTIANFQMSTMGVCEKRRFSKLLGSYNGGSTPTAECRSRNDCNFCLCLSAKSDSSHRSKRLHALLMSSTVDIVVGRYNDNIAFVVEENMIAAWWFSIGRFKKGAFSAVSFQKCC